MRITRHLKVPTGDIVIVDGEHGPLEFLSIGDYGKEANLKCQSMGLARDIDHVAHQEMLPLEEKWVITISTQYGCSMGCRFCDVPRVGKGRNATLRDMIDQVMTGLSLHPEVKGSERLNLHFARMGEPTWNPDVIGSAVVLHESIGDRYKLHPVVSTMMPRNNDGLRSFIHQWLHVKNVMLGGEAGLQLSINSTSEVERTRMFRGNALSLPEIASVMGRPHVVGRKITLNFAVADYDIDPNVLLQYFDPDLYIVKLTPMHQTTAATQNGIETVGEYTSSHPYAHHERALIDAGYEVIVFVTSEAEDLGRITCGNAILSGSLPLVEYSEVQK